MARSLTVHHDEKPATSSLLTAFLLLAFGWMALSALVGVATDADAVAVPGFDQQ